MCSLRTEGVQHGCGHYIATRTVSKDDCGSQYCIHSSRHATKCPHCPHCQRYLDPDSQETIVSRTKSYCGACEYWWNSDQGYHRDDKLEENKSKSSKRS